jgi:peroxiredoxin
MRADWAQIQIRPALSAVRSAQFFARPLAHFYSVLPRSTSIGDLLIMPLAVGTKAPDFTLPTKTADGPRPVRLSENLGNKNTLLLFFPMVFTGTCTTEMCTVGNGLREYADLNAEVYGISGDNPFSQEAWAQKEKITVTLLSDYEHKVTKEYGVAYDSFLPQLNLGFEGVAKRSAFIVDKNGVIQYVEVHEDARELPDFEKIKAKLAELK